MVTYTSGTTYNFKYPATNTLATTYPPGHPNRITPPISSVTATNITLNTGYAANSTALPNGSWGSLNDDNAACPSGFRVATTSESIDIISRYKATDNMKDLYVRLPSSIAVYTDYVAGTKNYYNPKLWGTNYTYNRVNSPTTFQGKTLTSNNMIAQSVDLRWDPAQQKFYSARTVDGKDISNWDGEIMWFSPGTFPQSSDGTYPDEIDRGYGYSTTQNYYTEHAMSNQMPIRCVKQ